jgi:hypothetical protein
MYSSIGSDPSQDGITDKNSFLQSDSDTHAVMYWGKSLLNYYYTNVKTLLPEANNQNFSEVILSRVAIDGTLRIIKFLTKVTFRNVSNMGATANDTQLTLFAKGASSNVGLVSYSIPSWDPLHDIGPPPADVVGMAAESPSGSGDPRQFVDLWEGLWPDLTNFLISLYWTIEADLGQINTNNVLINPSSLTALSAPLGDKSFSRATTGKNLQITPSTIFTSYLCQTTRLKTPLSLIVSVLIADLILLSSGWTVLTLIAAWLAKKKNHEGIEIVSRELTVANFCACASCAGTLVRKNYQELPAVESQGFKHDGRVVESLSVSNGWGRNM